MGIMKFCRPYLFQKRITLLMFISLSFIGSLINVIAPYIMGDFIDELVSGANQSDIIRFCIVFCGINAFKVFKDYITSIMYTKMQVKMGYTLNLDVIKHIQRLSISFFNQQDEAYLNQKINGDCYALITFCLTTLRDLIANVALFIIPFIVLFLLNKAMLLIFLFIMVIYVIIYNAMKKSVYNAGLKYRESLAVFFASLFEQIKNILHIKIDSVQVEFNKRTEESFNYYHETAIKSQRINFLYSGLDGIVAMIAQVVLFVVGGMLVIRGKFTVGTFTIFSSYFRTMLSSCRYFFGLAAAYQTATVSLDRIKGILNCPEESNGKTKLQEINTIAMKNVHFSYKTHDYLQKSMRTNSQNEYTKSVSSVESEVDSDMIKIDYHMFCKGNMYAIIGENGAGKTTLTKLLIGLYNDERMGQINYNNISISDVDLVHARRVLVGYAKQYPSLVEDSIYYNLTYQNLSENVNDYSNMQPKEYDKLEQLAEILNMGEFIKNKTLAFRINENGTNLSGGEKQKIAILKLLYKNPDVMIFDEPTVALDQETKDRFLQYLLKIKDKKIIIVVTHDDEVIACCDYIVEMPEIV